MHMMVLLFSVFKKELEKELRGETSGDFAKLLEALLKVRRPVT